jgi:hypothetical protein
VYAETVELTKELENRGYVVRCVLRSKLENTFQGQLGAALYRTSRGDFEALFLTKPRTFDSVHLVEREKNGSTRIPFREFRPVTPCNAVGVLSLLGMQTDCS